MLGVGVDSLRMRAADHGESGRDWRAKRGGAGGQADPAQFPGEYSLRGVQLARHCPILPVRRDAGLSGGSDAGYRFELVAQMVHTKAPDVPARTARGKAFRLRAL